MVTTSWFNFKVSPECEGLCFIHLLYFQFALGGWALPGPGPVNWGWSSTAVQAPLECAPPFLPHNPLPEELDMNLPETPLLCLPTPPHQPQPQFK